MVRPIGAPTREHSGAPTREHSGAPGVVSILGCALMLTVGAPMMVVLQSRCQSQILATFFGGDCSCNAVLLQLSRNLQRKRAWKAAQISQTSQTSTIEDC